MANYNIRLHSQLSDLSILRARVHTIFKKENLSDDMLQKDILLVLTELFVNYIKHGNPLSDDFIIIHLKISAHLIEIIIHDSGRPFNPVIKKPDLSELPESGFGLFIINSIMDGYEYFQKNSERRYNITKLTKKIKKEIPVELNH